MNTEVVRQSERARARALVTATIVALVERVCVGEPDGGRHEYARAAGPPAYKERVVLDATPRKEWTALRLAVCQQLVANGQIRSCDGGKTIRGRSEAERQPEDFGARTRRVRRRALWHGLRHTDAW